MDLTFDEAERELRRVEDSIAMMNASDGFIEDLVSHHAYRKELIAALSNRPRKRRPRGGATCSVKAPPEWVTRPVLIPKAV